MMILVDILNVYCFFNIVFMELFIKLMEKKCIILIFGVIDFKLNCYVVNIVNYCNEEIKLYLNINFGICRFLVEEI